jgi:hypothetical protein
MHLPGSADPPDVSDTEGARGHSGSTRDLSKGRQKSRPVEGMALLRLVQHLSAVLHDAEMGGEEVGHHAAWQRRRIHRCQCLPRSCADALVLRTMAQPSPKFSDAPGDELGLLGMPNAMRQ